MRLLLLDNYDSFTWNLYHALAREHDDVEVARNDELSPAEARDFDALVISPGPGLPGEAGMLMRIIPEFAGTKPMLGICLGHQAIAMHYGARLFNLSKVIHGKERDCLVTDTTDPLYAGLGPSFLAGRYHSWALDPALPDDLIVSCTDGQGMVMGFRHRQHPSWGLQFHPESIMTPAGQVIIRNWMALTKTKETT